jgi:predicted nucleic acid-binding protein
VSSRVLVQGAIRFADNPTVYDAVYLALAAGKSLPICTLDAGLAAAARRAGLSVLVPGIDSIIT